MAAYTGPRAAIHAAVQTTFSSGQAFENTRDGWQKDKYEAKNAEGGFHYDISRKSLNFAVTKDGIVPLRKISEHSLMQKYINRLKELQYKAYDSEAVIQRKSYVDWVISGDSDTLRKLAFGDQDVDFDLRRDNSHIKRMAGIETFAKDVYAFACEKFGEENVIGCEVHLDETTPHVHINTIPVAPRKTRGRASYLYVNKNDSKDVKTSAEWKLLSSAKRKNYIKTEQQDRGQKECVSFSGKFGETTAQRRGYLKQFHTDFFTEVGCKYGLARGNERETLSDIEQKELKHMTAAELDAYMAQKRKDAMDLDNILQEKTKKNELKLLEQDNEIEDRENRIGELDESIEKKETENNQKIAEGKRLDAENASKKDEGARLDANNQAKREEADKLDQRCKIGEKKLSDLQGAINNIWPEASQKVLGFAESFAWNAICNEYRRARDVIDNSKRTMSFTERQGAEKVENAIFDDEHLLKDLTDSGAEIVAVASMLFLGNFEMAMSYAQTSGGGGGGGSKEGWGRKKDEDDFNFMKRCFISACSMMKPPSRKQGIRR